MDFLSGISSGNPVGVSQLQGLPSAKTNFLQTFMKTSQPELLNARETDISNSVNSLFQKLVEALKNLGTSNEATEQTDCIVESQEKSTDIDDWVTAMQVMMQLPNQQKINISNISPIENDQLFISNEQLVSNLQNFLGQLNPQQTQEIKKLLNNLKENLLNESTSSVDPKVLMLMKAVEQPVAISTQSPRSDSAEVVNSQTANQSSGVGASKSTDANSQDSNSNKNSTMDRLTNISFGTTTRVTQHGLMVPTKNGEIQSEAFVREFEKVLSTSQFTNSNGIQKLVLKLYPENLGSIRIEIIQNQEGFLAKLHVNNQQVKQLLESHMQGLKQSFASQQLQIEKLEISSNLSHNDLNRNYFQQQEFNSEQSPNREQEESEMTELPQEDGSFADQIKEILKTGGGKDDR